MYRPANPRLSHQRKVSNRKSSDNEPSRVCIPDRGFPGERTELKAQCDRRKPGTGLVDRACRELRIDLANSWLVGDQTRDIESARRAGVRSILVQTGMGGRDGQFHSIPDHVADDLAAAAGVILNHTGSPPL